MAFCLLSRVLICCSISTMQIQKVVFRRAIKRIIWTSLRRYDLPCRHYSVLPSTAIIPMCTIRRHNFSTTPGHSTIMKGDVPVRWQMLKGSNLKLVEEENEHLHQILESSPKYHDRLMYFSAPHEVDSTPPTTTSTVGISSSQYLRCSDNFAKNLQSLKDVSLLGCDEINHVLKSTGFLKFCEHILKDISHLSSTEFTELLECLARLRLRTLFVAETRHIQTLLINTISKECTARIQSWDFKTMVKMADFLYAVRGNALVSNDFRSSFLCYALSNLSKLSSSDLILLMYHVNLLRSLPLKNTHQLEQVLLHNIQAYSVDELAIICLAFFKTKSVIHTPELMIYILESLLHNQAPVHSISVSAIMKALRYSSQRTTVRNIPHFQAIAFAMHEKFVDILPTLSLPSVSNILGFYRKFQYMSEDFLLAFYTVIINLDLSESRVKDIARTIFYLSNISVTTDSSIASSLIAQFEKQALGKLVTDLKSDHRIEELYRYPDTLVNCLVGLANMSVFDTDLIALLFSEQFKNVLRGSRLDFSRDLFHLSQSVAIERPDIQVGYLPCSIPLVQDGSSWNMVLPIRVRNILTTRDRTFQELVSTLQAIYDCPQIKENTYKLFKLRPVLTHHEILDIEMCFDDELKPVPPHLWNTEVQDQSPVLSRPPASELRLAIVLHGPTSYMMYKNKSGHKKHVLEGGHRSKVRQIDMLGYALVQISYVEFNATENKEELVKDKIQQAIHRRKIAKDSSDKITKLLSVLRDEQHHVPSTIAS